LKVAIQGDRVDMYTMTYNHEKYNKYEKECQDKYRDAWCHEHEYDFKKFKSFRSQNVLVGTDPSFGRSVDGYSLLFQTGKHTTYTREENRMPLQLQMGIVLCNCSIKLATIMYRIQLQLVKSMCILCWTKPTWRNKYFLPMQITWMRMESIIIRFEMEKADGQTDWINKPKKLND
jgi:hypothetical protein